MMTDVEYLRHLAEHIRQIDLPVSLYDSDADRLLQIAARLEQAEHLTKEPEV